MVRILFSFYLPLCLLPMPADAASKAKVKQAKRAGSSIVRIAPTGNPYAEKLEAAMELRLRSKAHAAR